MSKIWFFREPHNADRLLSKWVTSFGFEPVVIDPFAKTKRRRRPKTARSGVLVFRSLEEALGAWVGNTSKFKFQVYPMLTASP